MRHVNNVQEHTSHEAPLPAETPHFFSSSEKGRCRLPDQIHKAAAPQAALRTERAGLERASLSLSNNCPHCVLALRRKRAFNYRILLADENHEYFQQNEPKHPHRRKRSDAGRAEQDASTIACFWDPDPSG